MDLTRAFFGDAYRVNETIFWDMIDQWWEAGTFDELVLSIPASEGLGV